MALAFVLMLPVALAGPEPSRSQSDDSPLPPAPEQPPAAAQDLRYVVAIEGVQDSALRQLLQQVSETERLIDRPPPSLARLRRRAQDDRPRMLEVLRSEAYYAAQIEIALDNQVRPIQVTFRIDLGPVYRFGSVSIEVEPPEPRLTVPTPAEIGLRLGEPAAARTVLGAEQTLLNRVRGQGFILAQPGRRRAVVDHDTDSMDLTLNVQPGPLSRFGAASTAMAARRVK